MSDYDHIRKAYAHAFQNRQDASPTRTTRVLIIDPSQQSSMLMSAMLKRCFSEVVVSFPIRHMLTILFNLCDIIAV